VKGKVHSVLFKKNPGYEQICDIEEILVGKRTELQVKSH
jgi:hypothetical protein